MSSKTSFFNKGIFKKNITRFWPVYVIYAIVLFFMQTFPLATSLAANPNATESQKIGNLLSVINADQTGGIIFVIIFSMVSAIVVFSYLFNSRSCNMIHALPVNRKQLFFSNYVAGLLFLLVPQIIITLITLLLCATAHVPQASFLLIWLVMHMIIAFFFYSFAAFCCMLTGNGVMVAFFYIVGNFIYIIIKALYRAVADLLCFGFSSYYDTTATKDVFFSPPIYMVRKIRFNTTYVDGALTHFNFEGTAVLICYLIAAVAFAVLAYLFYQKRQLECAGDVVAFAWMKPIFRWIASIVLGTALALFIISVFFGSFENGVAILVIAGIIFSLLFFYAAEMILNKSFHVFGKKRWIEWVISAAVLVFIVVGLDADFFGVERRLPAEDKIAAIYYNDEFGITYDDSEHIEEVLALHKDIIASKSEIEKIEKADQARALAEENYYSISRIIQIQYRLNDGKIFKRSYSITATSDLAANPDSIVNKMDAFEKKPEAYLMAQLGTNYDQTVFTTGNLTTSNGNREVNFTEAQAAAIYEAYKKDVFEGNYPYTICSRDEAATGDALYQSILVLNGYNAADSVTVDDLFQNGANSNDSLIAAYVSDLMAYEDTHYKYLYIDEISKKCTNIIQALLDLGIIQDASELQL